MKIQLKPKYFLSIGFLILLQTGVSHAGKVSSEIFLAQKEPLHSDAKQIENFFQELHQRQFLGGGDEGELRVQEDLFVPIREVNPIEEKTAPMPEEEVDSDH